MDGEIVPKNIVYCYCWMKNMLLQKLTLKDMQKIKK